MKLSQQKNLTVQNPVHTGREEATEGQMRGTGIVGIGVAPVPGAMIVAGAVPDVLSMNTVVRF